MTMFPAQAPMLPPEFMEVVMANPGGISAAMSTGIEAFQNAMQNGGDMETAFESFGDSTGPLMNDLGISPQMFDAVGEMFGAVAGPALFMGPNACTGADMGAIMQDACEMMMPDGTEMPAEVGGVMSDFGDAMGDAGMDPHEVALEMMPDAGEPGCLPCGPDGEFIGEAGNPESFPDTGANGEALLQGPPVDGHIAEDCPHMMPPPDGYNCTEMPADGNVSQPLTYELAVDDGGLGALDSAVNTTGTPEDATTNVETGMDAAVGNAMDSNMDQGGSPAGAEATQPSVDDVDATGGDVPEGDDVDAVDDPTIIT